MSRAWRGFLKLRDEAKSDLRVMCQWGTFVVEGVSSPDAVRNHMYKENWSIEHDVDELMKMCGLSQLRLSSRKCLMGHRGSPCPRRWSHWGHRSHRSRRELPGVTRCHRSHRSHQSHRRHQRQARGHRRHQRQAGVTRVTDRSYSTGVRRVTGVSGVIWESLGVTRSHTQTFRYVNFSAARQRTIQLVQPFPFV